MRTYEPKIRVLLIKSMARDELVPGIAVDRRRYVEPRAIDLTDYLLENTPVRISKSVREPAGAFGFVLADKMHPELKESIYALVEPMDMVEIRMAHSPGKNGPPVVMRGFVSNITRSTGISSGQPHGTVHVSGQDFGKILQILRIYYLQNIAVGEYVLSDLKFFHKYAPEYGAKIMTGKEFVALLIDKLINPYMARLTRLANGASVGTTAVTRMSAEVSIEGVVSPLGVAAFPEGSVHQMLTMFLDVGAFNELFLEEREDGVVLVVRPQPFFDVSGRPIQSVAGVKRVAVDAVDVQELQVSRSDDGVANYFWVTNAAWQLIANETMKTLSFRGSVEEYAPFTHVNCAVEQFGFRKMETESRMGPNLYRGADAIKKEDKPVEDEKLLGWLVERRRILALQNRDNTVFENGMIRMRGNEEIRAGMYLDLQRGGIQSSYYVVNVHHEFVPFQSFKTLVQVERGTGWIARSNRGDSPYLSEMTAGGVK